jgi:integrase
LQRTECGCLSDPPTLDRADWGQSALRMAGCCFLATSWHDQTGSKQSDGVISLLSAMLRNDKCEWAFANPDTDKPYVSIFWAWDAARNKADLADVRVHDLRHSTASFLVNAGRTLYEVQHILGHTQVKTTQRYAHLSHDT